MIPPRYVIVAWIAMAIWSGHLLWRPQQESPKRLLGLYWLISSWLEPRVVVREVTHETVREIRTTPMSSAVYYSTPPCTVVMSATVTPVVLSPYGCRP